MKLVLLFALVVYCAGAPAPQPQPSPKPVPEPKANPGLLIPASPTTTLITSPVYSYSHFFKSPLYSSYTPYVYNLGYASGYSYNSYPYYVPLHII